jgi:phosphoserine phosphatase RsbU/P
VVRAKIVFVWLYVNTCARGQAHFHGAVNSCCVTLATMLRSSSREKPLHRELFGYFLSPLFISLLLHSLSATAQSKPGYFDATNLHEPTALSATWLIHAGDDPDGREGWAQPDFDDSSWTPCDPSKSLHNYFPNGNPGIVWYRLHLKVAQTQTGLALEEWLISSAVVGFTNGVQIFQVGRVAPFIPYTSGEQLITPIPPDQMATGSVVIALRVHTSNPDWNQIQPGLVPYNLILGQQEALRDHSWIFAVGNGLLPFLDGLISLGLGIAAILLYSAQSRRKEYLWLSLFCACDVLRNSQLLALFLHNVPVSWQGIYLLIYCVTGMSSILMYLTFIGQVNRRLLVLISAVASLLWAYALTDQLSFFALTGNQQLVLEMPCNILIALVLPALLIIDWRRGNREAGILLVPLSTSNFVLVISTLLGLLVQIPRFRDPSTELLNLMNHSNVYGFFIDPISVTDILSALTLALIILLRTNRLSRQGAVFENELAAAREVQQVLVPEAIEAVPGFTIETAYLPAQQVGGDFFQILPTANGGLLLVLGDVAGKGLPAAMLVSVLVGAIRTLAGYTHAPDQVLAQLNARMIGRSNGGFSTALAALFDTTGHVTIANAGHLSPYLDGTELELRGALPLGILASAAYESASFQLGPDSRVTFYSDGVIEAQDAKGQLFGFDRGQTISTQPALVIAEQAKIFGQSDDITVIAITRKGSPHR